ncbi:hypothetical protein LIER_24026 [Lithospermum erythrorhizon]|uniref:Uncharacterized protein n=1 Tax=Lithospermum erythrorhizon TaxID=34254 RepID=A0AAV3R156_LITER
MLVDTRSSADILYLQVYYRLGLPCKHLKQVSTPLTGFPGHSVYPTGIAELDLTVGEAPRKTTVRASFTVVDIPDPSYNVLIGRPLLNDLRAVIWGDGGVKSEVLAKSLAPKTNMRTTCPG